MSDAKKCVQRAFDALAEAAPEKLNEDQARTDILACIQRLKSHVRVQSISVKECRQQYQEAVEHLAAAKAFCKWVLDNPRVELSMRVTHPGGFSSAGEELRRNVEMIAKLEAWCSEALGALPARGKKSQHVTNAVFFCLAPWHAHAHSKISFSRSCEGEASGPFIEFCAAVAEAAGLSMARDSIGRGIAALRADPGLRVVLELEPAPDFNGRLLQRVAQQNR